MNQDQAWAHPCNGQELEGEHDDCEPEEDCDPGSEDALHVVDAETQTLIREANEQLERRCRLC
jgi:hypothetical protein